MKTGTVIPKGWKRATKKELKTITLDVNTRKKTGLFILWNEENRTWILDGSCIFSDGEIYLGQFHETYPMNLVYSPTSRKLIVVVPIKKRKPVKKNGSKRKG